MAPRTLVQLVPPGLGGVRDYADCLGERWHDAGIASQVLALSSQDARDEPLAVRLQRLTVAQDRTCSLLLHFSGYGFHERGLCHWLNREIDDAKRRLGSDLRVVTMFHELFAFGPPWRSAFWLAGPQASIAAELARASDALWTNTSHHARWLRTRAATAQVVVRPVFSTIGEPTWRQSAQERTLRLVVFGAESTRRRALAKLPRHIDALRQIGVREVVEAGSGTASPRRTAPLPCRFVGRLDTAALQALLQGSAFGLIDYPARHLGKSSVFAAYAVNGVVVLNTAEPDESADGLESGRHFLNLIGSASIPPGADARQCMAEASCGWYGDHTSAMQAREFAALCEVAPELAVAHG